MSGLRSGPLGPEQDYHQTLQRGLDLLVDAISALRAARVHWKVAPPAIRIQHRSVLGIAERLQVALFDLAYKGWRPPGARPPARPPDPETHQDLQLFNPR